MHTKVIVNPYASRWKAQKRLPLIREALDASGFTYDIALTESSGDGTKLALAAGDEGYAAVIAAGGDGTLNEVVNGLVRAAGDSQTLPLGILPVGTGNDFSDMAGLPRQIEQAVHVVAIGKTRQVDIGCANGHYFDNNCALAMEPLVTIENEKMTKLQGTPRYLIAVIRALRKLNAWDMRIEYDDGVLEGPTVLLSVCNGPRTGSTFLMAPDAKIDDGYFDFVHVPDISIGKIMRLLPRLLNGTHIGDPVVTHGRTKHLLVESKPGTPIHADGEVISQASSRVEYTMLPGKLTLFTP